MGWQGRRVPSPGTWRHRARSVVSQLAAAGTVLVLFIYLSLASDAFITANNLINIGVQSAVVAIIAIGMTIVIITAGIDLSVGSVAALSGVLGALLVVNYGVAIPLAIIGGTAIGAVAGMVNGLLVTQAGMAPFIATLGMLSVARGLVYIVTGSVAVSGTPPEFKVLGQGRLGALPIPVLTLVLVAVLGHLILTRTKLGRYAYAIGSNVEAARLSGVPVKRYLAIVYIISGTMAGLAGMIAASRVNSGQPNFGIGLELDVIAATVIGGASLFGGEGTVVGTLLGALLIALIRNGSVLLDINTFYQQIIIGIIIWIAVFWDQYRRRRAAAR
ncbi:MAG: ABC transporter permease [Pseudonocardiales bacterium]|nr:ABC transporter permease [Pseudonocardiales bacterium]MBV9652095.1 ABC transporter permease [Pseudonocardiales bacterium]